jgi:5-methylcytosine-specific restriction protein A
MAWSTESRHKRGYGTSWDKLRKQILERDFYLCQCNDCKGGLKRATPASEVDHIISKAKAKLLGWTKEQIDSPNNLQAINTDCHKAKTLIEQGKTYKAKVTIGLDGWPK